MFDQSTKKENTMDIENKHQAVAAMELQSLTFGDFNIPGFRISIKDVVPYMSRCVRERIVINKESPETAAAAILKSFTVQGNNTSLTVYLKYFCLMEYLALNANIPAEQLEHLKNETAIEVQRTYHKETGGSYKSFDIQSVYSSMDALIELVQKK